MSAGWSSQRKVVCRDWVQPADMQESVLQRGVMEYPAWLRNLAVCRLAQSHRLQETDVCTCLSWTNPAYKTDLSPSWWHIWCPPVAKPEIFNITYMFVPTFRGQRSAQTNLLVRLLKEKEHRCHGTRSENEKSEWGKQVWLEVSHLCCFLPMHSHFLLRLLAPGVHPLLLVQDNQ